MLLTEFRYTRLERLSRRPLNATRPKFVVPPAGAIIERLNINFKPNFTRTGNGHRAGRGCVKFLGEPSVRRWVGGGAQSAHVCVDGDNNRTDLAVTSLGGSNGIFEGFR